MIYVSKRTQRRTDIEQKKTDARTTRVHIRACGLASLFEFISNPVTLLCLVLSRDYLQGGRVSTVPVYVSDD